MKFLADFVLEMAKIMNKYKRNVYKEGKKINVVCYIKLLIVIFLGIASPVLTRKSYNDTLFWLIQNIKLISATVS